MANTQTKPMPTHSSLNELIEFFDTHDMGEYWDDMPEVHFEVNITSRKHLIEIDEEIIPKISLIAQSRKVSIKLLINAWLKEKILEVQQNY
jgi:hypothetical protein